VLLLAEVDRLTRAKSPAGGPLLQETHVLDAMWLAMLAYGGDAAPAVVQRLSVASSRE
jgi:hypothetical protein